MRRGRVLFLLAFVLIFAAVAVILGSRILGGGTQPPDATPVAEGPVRDAEIVIALQEISRGSEIPENAVSTFAFPSEYIVETMITDPAQVVGRRARQDIARGVPITQSMITDQPGDLLDTGSDAAIAIPPGFTAISVPISRLSAISYAVRTGDSVDVLAALLMIDVDQQFQSSLPNESTLLINPDGRLLSAVACKTATFDENIGAYVCAIEADNPPLIGHFQTDDTTGQPLYANPVEEQRPRLVTQRLIRNATVLHVGDFDLPGEAAQVAAATQAPADTAAGAPPQQQAAAPAIEEPDSITLIVTMQDALALNYAIKAGIDLTLTLRSPDDPTVEDETDSVTLQYLVDNYNITVPSRQPYVTLPRLVAPDTRYLAPQITPIAPSQNTTE